MIYLSGLLWRLYFSPKNNVNNPLTDTEKSTYVEKIDIHFNGKIVQLLQEDFYLISKNFKGKTSVILLCKDSNMNCLLV